MSTRHSIATTSDRLLKGRHRRPGRAVRVALAVGVSAGLSGLVIAGPALTPASAVTKPTGKASIKAAAVPAMPSGLPAAIEGFAPYVGQVSCDPDAKPGTLALGRLLTSTYPGTSYVVQRQCGTDSIASEHADGRALDWTVSARSATQRAQAEAFLAWLLATDPSGRPVAAARRLGVMYLIWNNRIWSSHNPLAGWQPYSTCTSHPETAADSVCHRDRLHVSLSWAGAMARTSFWTKTLADDDYGPCRPKDLNWAPAYTSRNATACPSYPTVAAPARASAVVVSLTRFSGATVGPGDSGPVVTALQKALGISADGVYGPFTSYAVAAFQTRRSLPPTGVMDAATWRALLIASSARTEVQQTPGIDPSPTGRQLTKYKGTVLKYGDRGAAVLALQLRLKVTASGWFGPRTRAAVVAFQVKARIPATGVVNAATWGALGA